MIPHNLSMSRESRKLLTDLEAMASRYNTSTIVTPSQVYVAEQITQKYYTAPIINAIKSKVKCLKKVSSKHFTVEHWVSVLDSIFQSNHGVRRDGSAVQIIDGNDSSLQSFVIMSNYLLTDYSITDSENIYKMIHTYTTEMIRNAVNTAVKNKVYNVQYVSAILEKEQAMSNMRKHEIEKLRERANNSNAILNRPTITHSTLDMAMNHYNWEQQKENAELERKMKEMFGE